MARAEALLKAEASVYDFAPSDGMEPPKHAMELALEMELLIYGVGGAYESTLIRISTAHVAEVARRTAAILLQRVARRNKAVRERRARFLEKHAAMDATSAMGAVSKGTTAIHTGAAPGPAASSLGGPEINQASLHARLEAEERAQDAACAASTGAHEATLLECSHAMEELEIAQKQERATRNAERALANAATVVQRCSRRFLHKMHTKAAEQKQARKLKKLLANLPPGAEHAAALIGTGYRRSLHVTKALTLQFARFEYFAHLAHPSAGRSLYSAHGITTIHSQLENALRALNSMQGMCDKRRSVAEAVRSVTTRTRAVRRLRGAIAFASGIAEFRPDTHGTAARQGRIDSRRGSLAHAPMYDTAADDFRALNVGRQGAPKMGAESGGRGAAGTLAAEVQRRLGSLVQMEAAAMARAASAVRASTAAAKRTIDAHMSAHRNQVVPGQKPGLRAMGSVIPQHVLFAIEGEGSRLSRGPMDLDSTHGIDGSAAGPLAARVGRCEGALDAIAALESYASPWMEMAGMAAMVDASQSRAMLAMKEARAANSLVDLAQEKLDDLEGRLDAGLRLHVTFTGVAEAQSAPRPIIKGLLSSLTSELVEAEAELAADEKERTLAEEANSKLHLARGRVALLRAVASRAAVEQRAFLHQERRRVLGEVIGSRRAYDRLKRLNAARRSVAAAVSQGEAVVAAEQRVEAELTAAKVRLVIVGVSDAAPLVQSRLNGPTLELLLGELMGKLAGLDELDWRRLHVSALTNAELPPACAYLAFEATHVHAVTIDLEVRPNASGTPSVSDVLDVLDDKLGAAAAATIAAGNASREYAAASTAVADAELEAGGQGVAPASPSASARLARLSRDTNTDDSAHADYFATTASHLGLSQLRVCGSKVNHPSAVGSDEASDSLPVTAPLRAALDAAFELRSRLADFCTTKEEQKEMSQELIRLEAAVHDLSPSQLFCLQHGSLDGDEVESASTVPAELAGVTERSLQLQRELNGSRPALKASRRDTREALCEALGTAAFFRRLQHNSQWDAIPCGASSTVDVAWNMGLLDEARDEYVTQSLYDQMFASFTGGKQEETGRSGGRGGGGKRASLVDQLLKEKVAISMEATDEAASGSWWKAGWVCYHCAQKADQGHEQSPPPQWHHRYIDCPARKRLALREFSPSVLDATVQEFAAIASNLDAIAHDLEPVAATHRQSRHTLLVIEGQLQFLASFVDGPAHSRVSAPLPPPPPPPPAPQLMHRGGSLAPQQERRVAHHHHAMVSPQAHLASHHAHDVGHHAAAAPSSAKPGSSKVQPVDPAAAAAIEGAHFTMLASVTRRVAYATAQATLEAEQAAAASAEPKPLPVSTSPIGGSPRSPSASPVMRRGSNAIKAANYLTAERRSREPQESPQESSTVAAPEAASAGELRLSKPPWSWIRSVLLMSPAQTRSGTRRPVSPDDVRDACMQLQLPVMGIDSQAHLMWLAVHFLNAPLPTGWTGQRGDGTSAHDDEPLMFLNQQLRETQSSHPLQQAYREVVRNFQLHPVPTLSILEETDALGWLHLVDQEDGLPYFFSFRTGQMQPSFPNIAEIAHSPLVQPRRVTLAQDAYMRTTPAFLAARSHVELMLADGVATPTTLEAASCGARSAHLWTRPMHLSPLLAAANSLGICPLSERGYMWIAHLSLCLPLPAGWVAHPTEPNVGSAGSRKRRKELAALEERRQRARGPMGDVPPQLPRVFYQHSLLGFSVVQWEPPQLSFCRGMLHALRKHAAAAEAHGKGASAPAQQEVDGKAGAEQTDAIRRRLRKQQHQIQQHGFTEVAYVTALNGPKRIKPPPVKREN